RKAEMAPSRLGMPNGPDRGLTLEVRPRRVREPPSEGEEAKRLSRGFCVGGAEGALGGLGPALGPVSGRRRGGALGSHRALFAARRASCARYERAGRCGGGSRRL